MKRQLLTVAALVWGTVALGAQARSSWVYPDAKGRLQYRRRPGQSHHGFLTRRATRRRRADPWTCAGGEAVKPVPGDNTAQIQAAIDEVSKLAVGKDGFRGAVLLERGAYDVGGQIKIAASGVVLRGSGSGEDGTVLRVTGTPHRVFDVAGTGAWQSDGQIARVTDAYVPAGSDTITLIRRPIFAPVMLW